jgi:hypothetical protein
VGGLCRLATIGVPSSKPIERISQVSDISVSRRSYDAVTLEDLGNIGEFVAAIAVVVSLVYVALQIRQGSHQISQNTNSVLGSVELETTRLHSDWLLSVAQSPELGRIWRLGISEPGKLTEDEKVRFAMLIGSAFYGIEGPFRQYQRGLLSEDSWQPMEELIARYVRSPAVLEWWANRDVPFARSFSQYVDSKISASSQNDSEHSGESIWSGRAV